MSYVVPATDGSITVSAGALTRIVVQAAQSVDGAHVRKPRRRVGLEIENGRAHVELELAVAYGKVLPDVARDVQERVASALTRMCGLDVAAVDVDVAELV